MTVKTLSAVLHRGSGPWVLLWNSSHTVCPMSLLLAQPQRTLTEWKQCPVNTSHQEKLDLNSELQKISHSLGKQHIMCKCVCTCHLTPNTELLPYIPGYFFLQNQAWHTSTHRGCLLSEVTKQARWLSLLQCQSSARSPLALCVLSLCIF